jgi:hypothetical protein
MKIITKTKSGSVGSMESRDVHVESNMRAGREAISRRNDITSLWTCQ